MHRIRKFFLASIVLFCTIASAIAQNSAITGKVTGSDGEVLTGATLVTGGVIMHSPTRMEHSPSTPRTERL